MGLFFRDPEQELSRNGQTKLGFKVLKFLQSTDSMRDLFISCEIFGTPRTHLKHHVPREAILLDVVWEVGEGIESLTIIYQDCFDFQVEAKCPLYSEGLIQK